MVSTNSWFRFPKPNPRARLRLFCLPYAGGGASVFSSWPDNLPSVQVCPVQLPGRENRLGEPLFSRLEPLVQALVRALRPYLNIPYSFFGHSLGALIGFELARALVRQNHPAPLYLFVSGHSAPQIPNAHPLIHHLPDSEFIKEVRRLNGTPNEVLNNAELMDLFLPVLRADFALNETYVYAPGPPLACPISAFGGLQDTTTPRDDLSAWAYQTSAAFTLRMFNGDHFFVHSARSRVWQAIAQDLSNPGQSDGSF